MVVGHPYHNSNDSKDDNDPDTVRGGSLRRRIGMMRRMGSLLGGATSSTDGLDELGIEFTEKNESEMDRNVALNRGLALH